MRMAAPQTMSASFANSDGWTVSPPKLSQFRFPLTVMPSGVNTRPSATTAAAIMGQASLAENFGETDSRLSGEVVIVDEIPLKLLEGRIGLPGIGAVRRSVLGYLPKVQQGFSEVQQERWSVTR